MYLRHEYRFESDATRHAFRTDRERYAAQNGGACGKMGALTGRGDGSRYAFVRGKLFLVASDSCRETFLKNEAKYFDDGPRDARKASLEERSAAAAARERVVSAHGGPEAVAALGWVSWVTATPYKDAGVEKVWRTRYAANGPDEFLYSEEGGGPPAYFAIAGTRSAEGDSPGRFEIHRSEQNALRRACASHPAGLLLGVGGTPETVNGLTITFRRSRVLTTVKIRPESGRIGSVHYRDHFQGQIQDVAIEFSDEVNVSGVVLPRKGFTRFGGAETPRDWSFETGPAPAAFKSAVP